MSIRQPAVAGAWYPETAAALATAVDRYLGSAHVSHRLHGVTALVAPHAGLMYSGPVAAYAYRLLESRRVDLIVLVGPSHFVAFEGCAVYRRGAFDTPFGPAQIDEEVADAVLAATPIAREYDLAHAREHSLEMQLPFVRRVAPSARIVPILMGRQTAATTRMLGDALGSILQGKQALLVASTDLSHYHDRSTASRLDEVVIDCVSTFDADRLQRALGERPDHACGGGPTVAVMRAARLLGATTGAVLNYGDSGDVSGDTTSVVGYLAAAFGTPAADPS